LFVLNVNAVSTQSIGSERSHRGRQNRLSEASLACDAVTKASLRPYASAFTVPSQYPVSGNGNPTGTAGEPIVLDASVQSPIVLDGPGAQPHVPSAALLASPVSKMIKRAKKRALKDVLDRDATPGTKKAAQALHRAVTASQNKSPLHHAVEDLLEENKETDSQEVLDRARLLF